MPDVHIEDVIADIRARQTRLSPYRLGLEVGRRGLDLASPYHEGSRAERVYNEGKVLGRQQRKAAAE